MKANAAHDFAIRADSPGMRLATAETHRVYRQLPIHWNFPGAVMPVMS